MTAGNAEIKVIQRPTFRVRTGAGRVKLVTMPIAGDVPMGLRDEIADHYQVTGQELTPSATTLDYFIGSASACLAGTFASLLAGLGQSTSDGAFEATGQGTIVKQTGRLRISGIHVSYVLRLDDAVDEDKVVRAHDRHHDVCPIASSISSSVDITSEISFV